MSAVQNKEIDRTSLPWPYWLLRYIASDDKEAFNDLIWSVGGSPPYGGVSFEEAGAVYELLEEYSGPGEASADSYEKVRSLITDKPDRLAALELFRIRDRIAGSPENFSAEDVQKGAELAAQLDHAGARAYFTLLQAELKYHSGEIPDAARLNSEGLSTFQKLAIADQVYSAQLLNASKNAVSFTAMNGGLKVARAVISQMERFGAGEALADLRGMLGPAPVFETGFSSILNQASDYLEGGEPLHALEWYTEAERLARLEKDESSLCGLLGDKAVAFRRIGNIRRAIETYEEAVALSRQKGDTLNLCRWSGNLGQIYLTRDDYQQAERCFKEALAASNKLADIDQMTLALANYASLLGSQRRFKEALDTIDKTMEGKPGNISLGNVCRARKFSILVEWGKLLGEEGQTAEALERWTQALKLSDRASPEEMKDAAALHMQIAVLHERDHNIPGATAALSEALRLFKDLGDAESARQCKELLRNFERHGYKQVDEEETKNDIEEMRRSVADAIVKGDQHTEATGRVNLATILLSRNDPDAMDAFEEALALVRRMHDRRRELILYLNFTPHLLRSGEGARALQLAKRAEKLAEKGTLQQKVLSALNLAQVWHEGQREPKQAFEYQRRAVHLLKEAFERDPSVTQELLEMTRASLAAAGKNAMELGFVDDAADIVALLDPNKGAELARLKSQGQKRVASPGVAALRKILRSDLAPILAAWRMSISAQSARPTGVDKILDRMANLAGVLGLKEAQVRLARALVSEKTSDDVSKGGPGGLIRLAEMIASGEIRFPAAKATAKRLAVPEDDLDCLVLFAMNDQSLSSSGASMSLLQLGAEIALMPERAGRFFNVLAMLTARDNPELAIKYYMEGDAKLTGRGQEAQRAHLRNEAAVLMASLGRNEDAMELARTAKEFAEAGQDDMLASMAAGNMGLALMQMDRFEEAVAVFEPLAERQRLAGDVQGLAITRSNLSACYAKLGRFDRITFDEDTTDPNNIFNQATAVGLQGDYDGAITLFNRGFGLIESSKEPYRAEPEVRSNFARTLFSAGRNDEAVTQMKLAATLLEKRKDPRLLHEAYSWLAANSIDNPSICEDYAERALQLGRQLADVEALAIDLGQLGQAKITVGRFEEAVTALQEANRLVDRAELKSTLADALVGAGRSKEAIVIYEEQMIVAEKASNVETQVRLLLGLADAHSALEEENFALALLQKAHTLAFTLKSPEHRAQASSRLGFAYLKANRLEEAARTLEEGVDIARAAGLWNLSLALLNNLGSALKEMGDLKGAESILRKVCSESRIHGLPKSEVAALASLGNVAATQERFGDALACYQEAADLAHEAGLGEAEADCLDSIGSTYSNQGKPERAIEYHRRAAQLHESMNQRGNQIVDLMNLAGAYLVLNEVENASAVMSQARAITEQLGTIQWQLPFITGQIAARQGDWTQARADIQDALLKLEAIRSSLKTPAQQRQWAGDRARVYQTATEAAIVAGDGGAAIEFSESGRARFLQSVLHRRSVRPSGVDEETWLRYQRAGDRLTQLRARRRAGLAILESTSDQELQDSEGEYARAFAAIQANGPLPDEEHPASIAKWENLVHEIPPGYVAVSLEAFSTGLGVIIAGRDPAGTPWAQARFDETFKKSELEKLVFGDRALIQQVISSHTPLDDLPLEAVGWALSLKLLGKNEVLRNKYFQVHGMIVRDPFRLATQVMARVCSILGERVWPAVTGNLPTGLRNVIIIPSAGFNLLPLHAARLADGSRFDEHYDVTYSPSLTLLKFVRAQPSIPAKVVLGQAVNPTGDLIFSSIEARAVAGRGGFSSIKSLPERDASIDKVIEMLKVADILHYSGHAYFDEQESFRSGLILGSTGDDGSVLTLGAILDSLPTIRSKFVILSACETGQVELEDRLNDFLGLPGGFVVAGAKAVLSTLWQVDDLASCLLLEKFFEVWRDRHTSVVEALTRAQHWIRSEVTVNLIREKISSWQKAVANRREEKLLLEQSRYWRAQEDGDAHPFKDEMYWAAFYLTGSLEGYL